VTRRIDTSVEVRNEEAAQFAGTACKTGAENQI
jgi:hypothetical protein